MEALAGEGLVVFAGPLAGSEHGRIRVLLIADADNEPAIRGRLGRWPLWSARLRAGMLAAER
jgi:hypothetical protein